MNKRLFNGSTTSVVISVFNGLAWQVNKYISIPAYSQNLNVM